MASTTTEPDPFEFLRQQELTLGTFHVEYRLPTGSDSSPQEFQAAMDHWFGCPRWRESGVTLSIVGTDWSGGMFCLWHHPWLDGRIPPVVYMGSSGDALSVLAIDLRAFVELLATGRVWGPHVKSEGSFVDDEQPPAHRTFRDAARAAFGFSDRPAEAIRDEACAAHPDFRTWVDGLTG